MRVALQVRAEGVFMGAIDNAIIAGDQLGLAIAGIFFQKAPEKSVGQIVVKFQESERFG